MKKSLTSFDLRVIALAAMFLDHVGAIVYMPYLETLPQVGFAEAIFYYALRAVGRIAFPLIVIFWCADSCIRAVACATPCGFLCLLCSRSFPSILP